MAGPHKTDKRPVRRNGAEPFSRKVDESQGPEREGTLVAVADAGDSRAVQDQTTERECALRSRLDHKWAAISRSRDGREDKPSPSLKDPVGQPLRHLCGRPSPLEQFLPLSISVVDAVAQMHASGLIHLRISPDSLLVGFKNSVSGPAGSGRFHAWLTGFGFAQWTVGDAMADDERTVSDAAAFAYLSPEQMGMPHQCVDVRADLYALGCVFYELLTGSPPFAAKDPMGWAHAHTAKRPRSVLSRRPSVPEQINAIVMKLLEKAPGERYQSAASLRADLERCRRMGRRSGPLETFPLNLHDIADRLAHSARLYGQQGNVKRLDSAFQKAKQGAARCVFVSGTAGSGKSSLANEQLSRPGADLCWSAASKCEPATHRVPYGSLSQVLDNLVRPLLGESNAGFESWRARLQAALGSEARALFPLVPVLERIVGN